MNTHSGSSSKVRLTLHISGSELALSQVGSRQFVVRDACGPLPAGEAEIVIEVNDSAERFKVFLPQGLPGPGQLVEYV
ncbi:MAG: hypothetical protein AB7U97_25650 [Pirellulales bacterium]